MKTLYYAFKINEYYYRRIPFTRHRSRVAAEKRQAVDFRIGEQAAQSDLETYIFEGRDAFEKWAKECNYRIDYKSKLLIYEGK